MVLLFLQQYSASCERPGMKRCVFWSIREWSLHGLIHIFTYRAIDPRPFFVLLQVKLKKTGDWRREILGDMTVMNAEEVLCWVYLLLILDLHKESQKGSPKFCPFLSFPHFVPQSFVGRLKPQVSPKSDEATTKTTTTALYLNPVFMVIVALIITKSACPSWPDRTVRN